MDNTEVKELEEAYQRGELDQIKKDLDIFLRTSAKQLANFQKKIERRFKKNIPIEDAIKIFILDQRSINTKTEIEEQLQSIKKISKKEKTTVENAGYLWAKKFSAYWRDHRTTSIIYVFHKNKSRYLKHFQNIEDQED